MVSHTPSAIDEASSNRAKARRPLLCKPAMASVLFDQVMASTRHENTWRVDAITWSENNTEAIAGLHNKGRRAFAVFDEASSI